VNERDPWWPAVVGGLAGLGLAGFGVHSLLLHSGATHPATVARWVVGLAIAHDLMLVPAVLVVGAGVHRWVPRRVQPILAGVLVVSGVLVLETWPALRGYGRVGDNPSILPRNYAVGLAVAVALVWVAGIVLVGVRARWGRVDGDG